MLRRYKWDWVWDGLGWDLCVGLLYEHRFAVLIINEVFVVFYEGKHYILSFLKDISVQKIVTICTQSQMKIFSYFSSSEA